ALFVVILFISVLTIMLSSKANRAFFEILESFSRLNSMVEENIRENQIVKAFANERGEEEKFDKENADFRTRNLESAAISSRYLPLIETFAGFMSVIAVGFGGWLVI